MSSSDLRVYRRRLDQEILPLLKRGLDRLLELTLTDQEEGYTPVHSMAYALSQWEAMDREFELNAVPCQAGGLARVLQFPLGKCV